MNFPTFKDYLTLSEDAASELAQLGMQKQQLVMKKAQADHQLDTQIAAIDKMIYQKTKQQEIEDKKNGVKPEQNNQRNDQNNQQQQQPQGSRVVQPGSTGSQTPGSAAPQQQGM